MTLFPKSSEPVFRRALTAKALLLMATAFVVPTVSAQPDLSRLQSILASTPQGGWVRVNTTTFSSSFPQGAGAVTLPSYDNPAAVVRAWSSFAWDSNRGDLLLFGGGHANYAGNEMYVWDATTGAWGLGSLPSRVDTSSLANYVVDNAAPQSAHTYDNNVYLPVNQMFLTLGGAAFQTGGNFAVNPGGQPQRAGPWLWDPTKADPSKVGGTTGSGYDPTSLGGQMWINRSGRWTGTEGPSYINGTTAVRVEGTRDVVYVTADSQSSGFPNLYRYTLGDVRTNELDSWTVVGVTRNTIGYKGSATLDTSRNLYVRNASNALGADLAVWNLSSFAGNAVWDQPIYLQLPDGTPFNMTGDYGIEYDGASDLYVIWDGSDRGKVWYTQAVLNGSGGLSSNWTIHPSPSTTVSQPNGNFLTGVLGKWKYVPELDAFIALDEFDGATGDAGVWLYKPFSSIAAIPELPVIAYFCIGAMVMGLRLRQRSS